jgi:muramoyltetrapeptide carboxypeptidase
VTGGGHPFRFPPALRPRDLITVVAPASGFEAVLGWRGLGFLAERYRVRFSRGIFERRGYLAGEDERRKRELAAALADEEVRAIVCARGGYGVQRIVSELPWTDLAARPKWIIGFSDITALHVEAARLGVASIHAPHLTALGRSDARGRAAWVGAVESPHAPGRHALASIATGVAEGPLVGGNLTILHASAAAGRLSLPEGCVLFLEDVTERPFRIDRMLTTLRAGGHLRRVAGVVLGDFTDCFPGPDRVTAAEVLRERLGDHGVPVASGAPCGHELRNDPLVLGRVCRLRVTTELASLEWG